MKAKLQLAFICLAFMGIDLSAQTYEEFKAKMDQRYKQFEESIDRKYNSYREEINARYADFMRKTWERYDVKPAKPVPAKPEPPKPAVKDPDAAVTAPIAAPKPVVVPPPAAAPKPEPVMETAPQAPAKPSAPATTPRSGFRFDYYGTACYVPFDNSLKFRLSNLSENTIADQWNNLTVSASQKLLESCLEWKKNLDLCDWGYVRFIQKMTDAFYGQGLANEACLMQMYLLAQSGYKIRIAKADGKLVLMMPFNNEIWQYSYLTVGSSKYFLIDSESSHSSVYLFDHEFPNEKMFSLQMASAPKLASASRGARTFTSKRYPDVKVSVSVNTNLINFYKDYPLGNDLNIYPRASLSESVKAQMYPALRESIRGLGEQEAVEKLLNFVQTGFEYKTDDEQFGFEKPFFADESMHYPFCDCEDRSILFSILVHDLLNLDVKLINYPGHVATAVRLNQKPQGYYFDLSDGTYTMCDPTYIGASAGDIMPQYEGVSATVIEIW